MPLDKGKVFSAIMKTVSSRQKNKSETDFGYKDQGALQRSSIMRASKDLVMSFPVLCSNTINPTTAAMITKAVERNAVTTLQLLFSSAYLKGYNGQDVIKKWHNNMDSDMSMDEYLDIIDSFSSALDESALGETSRYVDEMIAECVANVERYPESSFAENSINTFSVGENYNGLYVRQLVTENIVRPGGNNNPDIDPENIIIDPFTGQPISRNQFQANMDYTNYNLKKAQHDNQQQNQSNQNLAQADRNKKIDDREDKKLNLDQQKFGLDKQKFELDTDRNNRGKLSDQQSYFTQQLLDSDVKKANELVPSMIIVRFNAIDPDNPKNVGIEKQFIAGVKARLVPCDSFEIIDRIRSLEKNKVNLTNLIRATTKEISFARDFVAGIEQAKIDAKQNSKLSRTSPIWRSLQNRSTKSGLNRLKKKARSNDAGAITTLVVTQEEVNFLKKEYNLDINIPSKAKSIMEAYNLMCLVIVDEDVEVARFLFDGEKYYQDYSFNVLERETGDSSYKKVVNLISKINRG